MGAFAEGAPVSPQFTLRTTLAAQTQLFDSPRHKEPAGTPSEGLGGLYEQSFERVG